MRGGTVLADSTPPWSAQPTHLLQGHLEIRTKIILLSVSCCFGFCVDEISSVFFIVYQLLLVGGIFNPKIRIRKYLVQSGWRDRLYNLWEHLSLVKTVRLSVCFCTYHIFIRPGFIKSLTEDLDETQMKLGRDFSKLIHGFVSCYIYFCPLPNQTKLKFDQDFSIYNHCDVSLVCVMWKRLFDFSNCWFG